MTGEEPGRLGIDRLWAGWRMPYIRGEGTTDERVTAGVGSVFERILGSGLTDAESYITWRGEHCFALLNAFPYTSGHVLILPNRAIGDLEDLSDAESAELWHGTRCAVTAVKAAFEPDGVNVGMNLGTAAGAGVPDHLHVHVMPRWLGDTNFTTTVAEVRVMPESLSSVWRRLNEHWPDQP